MSTLLRGLRWLALTLVLLVLGYVAWAHWAWRDIPVAPLEQRYGDAALRSAVIDGLPIRYRLQGSGPAVVLIHNHFMDMGIWDAWLPQLSAQYTVLRYDLAGHGLTGPDPSGVYTVQRDVDLLSGLLQRLELGPVALVGSSLGGNIAFTLAAQQPQRVKALVLINSGGLRRAGSNSERELPAWADWLMPLIPPAAYRAFLHWFIADDTVITPTLETRFVEMFRRAGNRRAELARLRQYDSGDPDAVLAQVRAPTLILWGEANPQLPVALAQTFADKLGAAATVQIKTYPGAGHVLPVERPQSVRAVARFLETHP